MTRKLNPGAMGVATGARVFANALAGDPAFYPATNSNEKAFACRPGDGGRSGGPADDLR